MDVALRVWERYRLAARIADRIRRGDVIGDPPTLLRDYQAKLAKYAAVEPKAHKYIAAYEKLQKIIAEVPQIHDTEAIEAWQAKQKEFRQKEMYEDGRDMGASIAVALSHYGFRVLKEPAELFCFAVLQQLVLPPKLRKSIEVASKFWTRNPRLNPRGKSIEETWAKNAEMYLEMLETFRKHEKLFEMCLKEGTQHTEAGPQATKFKGGPFTLINTGGFDEKTMLEKAKICEEAAQKMHGIGLGDVCYGDVLITNRLSGEFVQAFYMLASDEMFVRADAKATSDTVRIVCHELAHRFEHKKLQGRKNEVVQLYAKINTHSTFLSNVEYPKIGTEFKYKDVEMKVVDIDFRRQRIKAKPVDPADRVGFTMDVQMYDKVVGNPPQTDPMDFVTAYAKRGGPSENFAEMVSFYAIGKLSKEQVDLLLPLLR